MVTGPRPQRKHQHALPPSLPAQAPTAVHQNGRFRFLFDGLRREEKIRHAPCAASAEFGPWFSRLRLSCHEPREMGLAIGAIATGGPVDLRKASPPAANGPADITALMSVAFSGAFLIGHVTERSPRRSGDVPRPRRAPWRRISSGGGGPGARYTPRWFLLACAVRVTGAVFLLGVLRPLRRRSWFRNVGPQCLAPAETRPAVLAMVPVGGYRKALIPAAICSAAGWSCGPGRQTTDSGWKVADV